MNLADAIDDGRLDAAIVLVIASRPCRGADLARERGLKVTVASGDLSETEFATLLSEHHIDWVVLAGYLHLVSIPRSYEGRIINIHPALLPEFGGPGMFGRRVHEAVLASGATQSGCTVHLCDDRYDHGPIVAQAMCDVVPGDTPQTLAARVFKLECELYPQALSKVFSSRVQPGMAAVRTKE